LLEANSSILRHHQDGCVSNGWHRRFFVVDGVSELPDSSLRSE
jgi:hypothetical protein